MAALVWRSCPLEDGCSRPFTSLFFLARRSDPPCPPLDRSPISHPCFDASAFTVPTPWHRSISFVGEFHVGETVRMRGKKEKRKMQASGQGGGSLPEAEAKAGEV